MATDTSSFLPNLEKIKGEIICTKFFLIRISSVKNIFQHYAPEIKGESVRGGYLQWCPMMRKVTEVKNLFASDDLIDCEHRYRNYFWTVRNEPESFFWPAAELWNMKKLFWESPPPPPQKIPPVHPPIQKQGTFSVNFLSQFELILKIFVFLILRY